MTTSSIHWIIKWSRNAGLFNIYKYLDIFSSGTLLRCVIMLKFNERCAKFSNSTNHKISYHCLNSFFSSNSYFLFYIFFWVTLEILPSMGIKTFDTQGSSFQDELLSEDNISCPVFGWWIWEALQKQWILLYPETSGIFPKETTSPLVLVEI